MSQKPPPPPPPPTGRYFKADWTKTIRLQAGLTRPQKMTTGVLLAVARGLLDYGDSDGTNIQVATTTIAAETEFSHPTVSRARSWLIDHGFLHVDSPAVWYPGGVRNGKPAGKAMWVHAAIPGMPCQSCPPAATAANVPANVPASVPASVPLGERNHKPQTTNPPLTTTPSLTNGADPASDNRDGGDQPTPQDTGPPTVRDTVSHLRGGPLTLAMIDAAMGALAADELRTWAETFRAHLPAIVAAELNLHDKLLDAMRPWHDSGCPPGDAAHVVTTDAGPNARAGLIAMTIRTTKPPTRQPDGTWRRDNAAATPPPHPHDADTRMRLESYFYDVPALRRYGSTDDWLQLCRQHGNDGDPFDGYLTLKQVCLENHSMDGVRHPLKVFGSWMATTARQRQASSW